jgi:V-type H+-transporting ATPase proteolipid subunit
MGMVSALVFTAIGSAYGMAKSGVAVTAIGIMHHDKLMKSLIPVIMAGMIGIYGVLIAIVLTTTKCMNYCIF